MIGRKNRTSVARGHGIGIFLATQPRCGETVADLNTLDRIDAHASRRQFAVELGVKRRAPAGRNAGRNTFGHSAQRRTILACAIDQLLPTAGSLRIGTEERIIANLRRIEIAEVDGVRSEEHTTELQSLMRNSYAVF